ncbi:peptidase M16 domain-containing protein [Flammeovirgaceae bacterium 311]|nr:peptidase M16 domain-containing protein [Flammeovirgaceae bacterium 311]
MIDYKAFTLKNGLQVFVHEDNTTPMAAVNILYNVGSKDEDEHKTGFAHLFEHLMFGGSMHIGNYDEPLQRVGGENNAFTSPDITNYYITLPAENLETAFWLESDRMMSLSFDPKVLEVQRKVVIEEFKQRYLNQPYGDAWLKLRPLAYQKHPYRWATIGREIKHIEDATLDDVRRFFFKYYLPNNAIMVVAGNVNFEEVKSLTEKWFGSIPAGAPYQRQLPAEPKQTEARLATVEADVPLNAIYKTFHMPGRNDKRYYIADLLSDVLGRGKSSLLYQRLVRDTQMFADISGYVTGSMEPGLLVISGKLKPGFTHQQAEEEITAIISQVQEDVSEEELQKVKNQAESSLIFSEIELLNRAMNLAFSALLGDPDLVNKEAEYIQAVTAAEVKAMAREILVPENSTTLHYVAKQKA